MFRLKDKLLAWGVHVFTSLGLLCAFMAIIAIDQQDWRSCFIWLFLCFIIDSLDGSLARKFNVSAVLPNMDGKNIDYVIDFTTYALIPAIFFYKAEMVEAHLMMPALVVMLISSALYYGKVGMVEDEQYFVGFPVLWNFVVFFQFFVCNNQPWLNFASVLFFGFLHFVPLRFAYPSRAKKFFWSHLIFSIIGLIGAIILLYQYPVESLIGKIIAISGAIYFAGFAVYDTLAD